jgi:membrane dipeptidase
MEKPLMSRPVLSGLCCVLITCATVLPGVAGDNLANEIAHDVTIIDTHVDLPYRLIHHMEDISGRTAHGNFDYPRAVQGGLNVPFMSIYVPSSYEGNGAKAYADQLIALVDSIARTWPDKFALVQSVDDVRTVVSSGRIALPMGMENGSPIEGSLANIRYFYDKGIRYITLAHAKDNHISDSSYDTTRTWNGLSPFGRTVVAEMNRVGIMVDVSHISDSAFYQVIAVSAAPVIASHSACRFFTPGFERNMSDDMIRLLAAHGGVIQIPFGSSFIRDAVRTGLDREQQGLRAYLDSAGVAHNDDAARPLAEQYLHNHGVDMADVSDVAVHIDHVVRLAGIDHVGIGSDFEGVGDTLPVGLKDVSCYPNLIAELLKRGYSRADIEKICSGNILRVWKEVEQTAQRLQKNDSR